MVFTFGLLPLVDEVLTANDDGKHEFRESSSPASRIENLLDRPCRVLPNEGDARYFAYRIGVGKNLEPGRAYVLTVDFPDGRPRTMFIHNRGDETIRGRRGGRERGASHAAVSHISADFPCSWKIPRSKSPYPLFEDVYNRQRERGKHHLVALSHVANKMLHVVFSVLKNNRPYTPMLADNNT